MSLGNKAAFTLIEVVVTIGLFSLILVTMFAFVVNGFKSFRDLNARTSTLAVARQALERTIREMREATQSDLGAYTLNLTAANELIFYANVDAQTDIERVRYHINGTDLIRGIIKPSGVPLAYEADQETNTTIARNVHNGATPLFSYFDENYTGSGSALTQPVVPATVRFIKITIIIDDDVNAPPNPVTVTSGATFRNLKDNL